MNFIAKCRPYDRCAYLRLWPLPNSKRISCSIVVVATIKLNITHRSPINQILILPHFCPNSIFEDYLLRKWKSSETTQTRLSAIIASTNGLRGTTANPVCTSSSRTRSWSSLHHQASRSTKSLSAFFFAVTYCRSSPTEP